MAPGPSVVFGNPIRDRIVAELALRRSPRRHHRVRVGPADADAAGVCCLQRIRAGAHPVIGMSQRYAPQRVFARQLDRARHARPRIDQPDPAMAFPLLDQAVRRHAFGRRVFVEASLLNMPDKPGEPMQAVRVDTIARVVGEDLGTKRRAIRCYPRVQQHAMKLAQQWVVRHTLQHEIHRCICQPGEVTDSCGSTSLA